MPRQQSAQERNPDIIRPKTDADAIQIRAMDLDYAFKIEGVTSADGAAADARVIEEFLRGNASRSSNGGETSDKGVSGNIEIISATVLSPSIAEATAAFREIFGDSYSGALMKHELFGTMLLCTATRVFADVAGD